VIVSAGNLKNYSAYSNMIDVPIPQETGSSGTQQTALTEVLLVENASPIYGLPITQAVQGLVASNSKNMGGEVTAKLLLASLNQMAYDFQATKNELKSTLVELQSTSKELSAIKVTAAVLDERVNSIVREQRGKDIFNIVGGLLIGISYDLFKGNFNIYGFILAGLGLLLLYFGFSKYKDTQK
jgi:hypothetical protein